MINRARSIDLFIVLINGFDIGVFNDPTVLNNFIERQTFNWIPTNKLK